MYLVFRDHNYKENRFFLEDTTHTPHEHSLNIVKILQSNILKVNLVLTNTNIK